ncbi:MAG: universal stress protein [Deltaproteobacteria bacterium]|nr:universal stress protein [Deltaproteobacteria bacterium]
MHRILLPVDGSESSLHAVDHVIGLSQELGPLEVRLLNVQEPPIVYGEVAVYVSERAAEAQRLDASERQLADAARRLKEAGVPFTSQAREGHVADEIARVAEEEACQAIVMGTHGMGAVGNLVMGSVATKVIHRTRLPVTLVH